LIVSAIVSVLAGLFIVARLPGASLVVLGLVIGINFLSTGFSMIMLAQAADQMKDKDQAAGMTA
jgi:uncharacterized membrane protein HdeD (DUF308 family)